MKSPKFFKGNRKAILTIAVLIVLIAGVAAVNAATTEPGSDSDPIVTKSYVDSAISSALANNNDNSGSSSASYEVVHVDAGKKVIATGATEMILRSGTAQAIDNGSDGVSDMTSGIDLMKNYTVRTNHLLLIPRDDGRGIRTTSECYVMVRGPYEIQ